MNKKHWTRLIILYFPLTLLLATDIDSSYSVKWQTIPWGSGGLEPAGPPWSMVGPYDFDNDGYGDFIVASAYTGVFCNDVIHYEAVADDSIDIKWVYTFSTLSCQYDNYSSVAVGDIDNDQNPEILALMDTRPGVSGQDGLQIFEWDPTSLSFPDTPTATWSMLLDSVWEASQILVEEIDNDGNQEIIVSVMDGPWGSTGSSRIMIIELENGDLSDPVWNIEYEDPVTTNWSGYNISVGDLDQDGLKEIYTVAYEYYHIIIYENLGTPDEYDYQTDFYVTNEVSERANQSIVIADLDSNGTNEMFAVTSGTNSLTGTLLTPGYFYAVICSTGVDSLTFANFHYLAEYPGGLRQLSIGDADQDGKPNLYIAGHYNEAVFDWEYNGGNLDDVGSYSQTMIFMDDTTDNFTPNNDQGKVRVAKLFSGDIDNDGNGDVIFSSASFATDKPQLFMVEHEEEVIVVNIDHNDSDIIPNKVSLEQNFPNPFNPATAFQYNLAESGIIELTITDIIGRKVTTLISGYQRSGNHNVLWTGKDSNGNQVPSGIYFYNLKSGSNIITKKMTLSK
ncbi:MAG: FG-GAP-like repeat-containing protein [Candidatus Neomarinimicrobiota bacterium]|nr:FG-GAP-like repeat-containing protein [Candidatus Neomarinimicrobiota bacterium]